MVEVRITQQESGKKLHRYIRQLLPGVPLSGVYKMLRTGRVKVNGKRAKSDTAVRAGDLIHLYMGDEDFQRARKPTKKFSGVSRDVNVVFEDDEILVVSKPAGLLVHGAAGEHKDTLVNRVLAWLFDRDGEMNEVFSPAPVNRLDRNTSGLVIFGKSATATARISADIAAHQVSKWYLAIVRGELPQSGEIDAHLARDAEENRTRVVASSAKSAKSALTRFVRQAVAGSTSVAKIELVSGRTHQIRAHLQQIGHPLWGDVKYGGRTSVVDDAGQHQWLHAAWIELGDGRRFSAPLPDSFRETLRDIGYTGQQIQTIESF